MREQGRGSVGGGEGDSEGWGERGELVKMGEKEKVRGRRRRRVGERELREIAGGGCLGWSILVVGCMVGERERAECANHYTTKPPRNRASPPSIHHHPPPSPQRNHKT